jgi:hypothetical protein
MSHQQHFINGNQIFSLPAEDDYNLINIPNLTISRPGLYPSEASVEFMDNGQKIVVGKCMRAAWYRAMGVQPTRPVSPGLAIKGRLGKWAEQGMIDEWKKAGLYVQSNVKFYNKALALSGELDAVLRNPLTGHLIGLEMKTFYGYPANRSICGVKREKGTGRFIAGRPKDDHFLQACVYAWEYRGMLDEYRLYYLERGDGHRIEFKIGFALRSDGTHQCFWEQLPGNYWNAYQDGPVLQPYAIEGIHGRYKTLLSCIAKAQIPPKDFESIWDADMVEYRFQRGDISKTNYDKWGKNPKKNPLGDWHCSYCDYSEQCKQDELTS